MLTETDIVTSSSEAGGYVTLDSIDQIVVLEDDVDTKQGRFRVRALNFGEMLKMKEGIDEGDEWEATKRMLMAGLLEPAVTEANVEVLGKLAPSVVGEIVEAITKLSGLEVDDEEAGTTSFSEGSPTR